MAARGHGGIVAALRIEGEEVEKFVSNDGAAEGCAELLAAIERLDFFGRPVTVRLLHGHHGEGVGGAQGVVTHVVEDLAVQLVPAATGDGVDHGTGGAAILGGEVGSVDLELPHGCLADDVADAASSALFAEECLVVVRAIDGAVIHQSADAAKADQAEVAIKRSCGREQGEVGPAPAIDGEIIDEREIQVGGKIGLGGIDRRSFVAHLDGLVDASDRKGNFDFGDAPDLDDNACVWKSAKPL